MSPPSPEFDSDRFLVAHFFPDWGGTLIRVAYNPDILVGGAVAGRTDRTFQIRDRYVLDLSGDVERRIDRRVAIGLDALQSR